MRGGDGAGTGRAEVERVRCGERLRAVGEALGALRCVAADAGRLRPLALLLPLALLAACGGGGPQSPPPPAVDLSRQAEAASEIVDPALLQRHTQELLAAEDPARYLTNELWRIGLVPGGAKGGWWQPFENRRHVARTSVWVLSRGDARATLGTDDVVAALPTLPRDGGRAGGVRLRGLQAVFVAPTLAAPAGALRSKVLVVLEPVAAAAPNPPAASTAAPTSPGQTASPSGAAAPPSPLAPLPDLLRRAAAAGAHAVVVLPRPGTASTFPTPARAAELAANSGVLVVAWLDDVAARALVRIGLDLPLEALPRLEWRSDLLPLPLGTVQAEVKADVEREPHHNLLAVLPGRSSDEAVAVIATLPGSRRRAGKPGADSRAAAAVADMRAAGQAGYVRATTGAVDSGMAASADPHAETAAAAELLAVATAFQALSDPPRRTVVFAFTDPGDDGLAGANQLLADPRFRPPHLSAGIVLAAANLGAPTQDVSFVGARASSLYGMTARLAALQGRRVVDEPVPWRGLIWHSPAWALIQARVPVAVLEPGVVPRPGPSFADAGSVVPAAAAAPQPAFSGMLEDARLAFRAALELAEGSRPPRVDPARAEAVLRQSAVVVPTPIALPLARLRRAAQAAQAGEGVDASAPTTGGEAAASAQPPGPQAPGLSSVPEFVAPPPSGTPPPALPSASPRAPVQEERPSEPAPTATPPQLRR